MKTSMMMSVMAALGVASGADAGSAQMCVMDAEQSIAQGADGEVVMSFVLPEGATVTGVVVDIDLDHTWLGDLVIQVEHDGTVVKILDRVNLGFFPYGCGGRDIDASFRDDATVSPVDLCVPSKPDPQPEPMLVGDLIPAQALAGFDGLDAGGQWTITVADLAANDSGTLHTVCLTIEYDAPSPCVGDVNGSGGVDVDDLNALLSAWGTDVGVGSPLDVANDDGIIDVDDLNVVLGAWGAAC